MFRRRNGGGSVAMVMTAVAAVLLVTACQRVRAGAKTACTAGRGSEVNVDVADPKVEVGVERAKIVNPASEGELDMESVLQSEGESSRLLLKEAEILKESNSPNCEDALELVRVASRHLDPESNAKVLADGLEIRWQCLVAVGQDEAAMAASSRWAEMKKVADGQPAQDLKPERMALAMWYREQDYLKGRMFHAMAWDLIHEEGDSRGALALARRTLALADTADSTELRFDGLVVLALSELLENQVEASRRHGEEALRLGTRLYGAEHLRVREIYRVLGLCERASGRREAALKWMKRFIKGSRPDDGGHCEAVSVSVRILCADGYEPACRECRTVGSICQAQQNWCSQF